MGLNTLRDCIVIKFGGSVLDSESSISKAAELVRNNVQKGSWVVVVVSAMKGVTDSLITLSKQIDPTMNPSLLDELLASGEKTSARLVAAALASHRLSPAIIDPDLPTWPIITDEVHQDANPIMELTQQRVDLDLVPLLERGLTPVVCGFLGKTVDNKTTTLGRGGSDTTAVVLGHCLRAKEVLLIKDVEGVYSSDPDQVTNPEFIENLDGKEAELLTAGGAKFLHSKALRYQMSGMKIRVTSLSKSESGTVIQGDIPDVDIQITSKAVSMLTIVGVDPTSTESIGRIASVIRESGGRILSLSLEESSAIFYIDGGKDLLKAIHSEIVKSRIAKAVSSYDKLSMVSVKGRALETQPGVVQRVTQPLARARINLYGIVTIHSSIRLFVSTDQTDSVRSLIRDAVGVGK